MKKTVCQYCGKILVHHQQFCDDHCARKYDQRIAKDHSKIKYFLAGIMIGVIALFIGAFSQDDFYVAIGMMVIGITITVLPLATPDTIRLHGYRKARMIGRILGILCIFFSIWIMDF